MPIGAQFVARRWLARTATSDWLDFCSCILGESGNPKNLNLVVCRDNRPGGLFGCQGLHIDAKMSDLGYYFFGK